MKKENQNIAKISNNILESYVKNSNLVALKILIYISKNKFEPEQILTLVDDTLYKIRIDTKKMLEYTQMSYKNLERNLKKMTEKSIEIPFDTKKKYVNILPWVEINKSGYIEIQIFGIIIKLTHALKNYSTIDVRILAILKSSHSIKMLMILERINNFSDNTPKRKKYTIEELNGLFATNYKTYTEFARRVLEPAKQELDKKSDKTFLYELKKDKLERNVGRARVVGIVIDLVDKNKNQKDSPNYFFDEANIVQTEMKKK